MNQKIKDALRSACTALVTLGKGVKRRLKHNSEISFFVIAFPILCVLDFFFNDGDVRWGANAFIALIPMWLTIIGQFFAYGFVRGTLEQVIDTGSKIAHGIKEKKAKESKDIDDILEEIEDILDKAKSNLDEKIRVMEEKECSTVASVDEAFEVSIDGDDGREEVATQAGELRLQNIGTSKVGLIGKFTLESEGEIQTVYLPTRFKGADLQTQMPEDFDEVVWLKKEGGNE